MSKLLEWANNRNKKIFIYGVSPRGEMVYNCLVQNGIEVDGYIVSDSYNKTNKNIFYLSEIEVSSVAIVLAVKYRSFNDVIPQIVQAGISDIYFLSGEDIQALEYYNTCFDAGKTLEEMYPSRWKAYESAKKIFEYIGHAIPINSAIDFGCGSGAWLKAVKDLNSNAKVLGLDNSTVDRKEFLEESEFELYDLCSYEFKQEQKYDIAISIEVAEHVEKKNAEKFIDNLCMASDVILFSAAIKYQGGEHHVNEQYVSYWVEKFEERGYGYIDCIRSKFWDDEEIILHCRQNCVLYVKKEKLEEVKEKLYVEEKFRDFVHPEMYDMKMRMIHDGLF